MLLDFEKTKELLKKYQIPLVESLIIENLEQGVEFANRVGFPVVLKLISSDILHKIDKGLVKLNVQNAQDVEIAFKELGSLKEEGAEFLLQKQVSGTELFFGMKRDKSFGPVVSFGLGGIFVEVLEDIAFGICPIEKEEAAEIIKSIKGRKILEGFRGQKGVDIDKLANILSSISKLAVENENIQEIDFNPAMASGSDIFIVDPKVIF
ncbi:MAG: acetate--CoA ligase family protein [Patescibacteria group bacterium]